MNDIIDFDTGSIIDGKESVEECSKELLNKIEDLNNITKDDDPNKLLHVLHL